MFTGIIEEIGVVKDSQKRQGALVLSIAAQDVINELKVDDSIAIAGVCLTVTELHGSTFQVDAVEETLRKTTLGSIQRGDQVNLEPSLRLSDRMGGHLVQGHVDGVGYVVATQHQQGGKLLSIRLPHHLMKYVISEGSIAVDGVSLTVARLKNDEITLALIPHTLEKTTLSDLKVGDRVNVEVDLIGKYIESLMAKFEKGTLTDQNLQKMGYE